MEAFRKVIKGWLGKVLLVLFLTPLALVGIEGYFSGGKTEDTAQLINGDAISKKELEALTASFKEQYLSYVNGDETLLNQTFIENKALDSLVARTLLLQQAEKLGIALSDSQIEQMVAQQPNFQENGQFSETLYANYLRSVGMTSQSLITNLRQDHALKMLSNSFLQHALVSQKDIQQIVNLQTEQRTLHLASIPLDEYKKAVQVSDQEATQYYNAHKNAFKQVASVDVDYVVLAQASFAQAASTVTEAELEAAYDKFVASQQANVTPMVKHILVTLDGRTEEEAKARATAAQTEIQQGATFAATAAKYSEDPDSKAKGGVIEGYAKGIFGDEFDQAVTKASQVALVKTQYGFHVIEAQAATANVASFASEKPRLEAEILKTKAANAFSDRVNALNELVVSSDALDVISQEVKGAQVQTLKAVTLNTQHPVLSDASVKPKLFNNDVENGDRNVSSSLQLANGDVVWVKVRDYHAAGVQTLAEAMPRVKATLIEKKAAAAATAKIQAALNEFKTQPAAQVRAKHAINFVDAGRFARSQGLLKRDVERAAFSVGAPKEGHWSVTTATLPNELIVVAVSKVQKNTENLPAEAVTQLASLYENLRAEQELDDYTRYLKSKAKIK